jgi:hypothetical protein
MGFEIISSHLEFNIFKYTRTFHHTSIGDRDLKVVYQVYKKMGLFFHSLVNEILSTSTVNYEFMMFDVAYEFQGLWSQNS